MASIPPPRLYAIVAKNAPVALVFRRGPTDWYHLLKWNLDNGSVEGGAWVKKKLFPERCDLSADGSLMLFYLSGGFPPNPTSQSAGFSGLRADGGYGVFAGISRVPWLHPLVEWDEHGTHGCGWTFVGTKAEFVFGQPERYIADNTPIWIQRNDAHAFINERRRGWNQADNCPSRSVDHARSNARFAILEKMQPGSGAVLRVDAGLHSPTSSAEKLPRYRLHLAPDRVLDLPEAQWADWDPSGRLLMATGSGHLRIEDFRGDDRRAVIDHDLSALTPEPRPAPDWARSMP